ncbi:mycobacterial-type methylenetetrahydrofolate reductase, partial [Mycolicibacterium llatzerense]
MSLKTIALELVPPNLELGLQVAVDEAHKVLQG